MLQKDDIQLVLERARRGGADFAELFLEDREDTVISYDGGLNELSTMRIFGAGIHLLAGTGSVYVCTSDTSLPTVQQALEKALSFLAANRETVQAHNVFPGSLSAKTACTGRLESISNPCPVHISPGTITHTRKIAIIRQADAAASAFTSALQRIRIDYFDRDQRVRIINTLGTDVEDRRVTTRLRFIPLVANDQTAVSWFTDYSTPAGYEALLEGQYLPTLTGTLRTMEETLYAEEAVGGRYPVILERGNSTGTFFHEACGHQLETTELRRGGLFLDRLNTPIASERGTLGDDGTLPGAYGSSRYDDEGIPRQRNVLIDRGILTGFLTDRLGARILGLELTGSGRRQDYSFAPGARMSNTFLTPGDDDDERIISDTEEGLYVTEIGGGTGGPEFTLYARSAFRIRNGTIDRRVRGAMLTGRGDETMLKIDQVGQKTYPTPGEGSFCGADSGFCPVTAFGPRIRISDMLVGAKGGGS